MKKATALLLVLVMVCSLFSGCSMIKNKIKEEIKDTIGDAISDATGGGLSNALDGLGDSLQNALGDLTGGGSGSVSDILNGIGSDVSDAIGDAAGSVIGDAADGAISAVGRHDATYWCEKFGANHCPFSINALGIDLPYYFRDGGYFDFWVFTEENTGGWYVYNGYVISEDNAFAIKIDEADSFSSCCTYDAKAYVGEKLDKDERASFYEVGAFYTLNSYTPIPTNWGIKFLRDEDEADFDDVDWKVYSIAAALLDQEYFNFYVAAPGTEYTEAITLWAYPHQDRTKYPEILTEEYIKAGTQIGTFGYDEENHCEVCRAYVPNKEAGGFGSGLVDLLITYGDTDYVTVGVFTVDTGVGGKG